MAEIQDLTTVDASNTARFPEAMAPSAVNNGARALEGIVARFHRDLNTSVTTAGTSTAYTYAANQTLSAYYDGLLLGVDFNAACGTAPTINVDSVGAKNLVWPDGTSLTSSDVLAGQKGLIVYDGANFQVITISSLPPSHTKEFFVYVAQRTTLSYPYNGLTGNFPHNTLTDGNDAIFLFHIPNDFTTLTDAVVVVLPDASETIQWDIDTDFGANGEAYNANTDSVTDDTLAVTLSQLAECDVSAGLTGIAAGDYVGMSFQSNTTNIQVVILRIRYI